MAEQPAGAGRSNQPDPSTLEWRLSSWAEDGSGVEVAFSPDRGTVYIRTSGDPKAILAIDAEHWRHFVIGARLGEFNAPRRQDA